MKTTPRPETKPSAKLEVITPEWACAAIEKHEAEIARGEYNQRPFSEKTAQAYAVAMQHGHWLVNDQGIMFDTLGRLRNGRHRLWAVIMAGVSVEMWVMRDCSDKEIDGLTINVVDTVDVGRTRNAAAQLAIDGVKNSGKLAGACRCIARIAGGDHNVKMTVIQTRQILEIYGAQINRVLDALHNSGKLTNGFLLGPVTMYRAFAPAQADQFCADYFSMQNLPDGSPVIALSKFIQIHGGSGGNANTYAMRAVALALSHYDRGGAINSLRQSDLGVQWLIEKQRANCKAVRAIIGVDFRDHRA